MHVKGTEEMRLLVPFSEIPEHGVQFEISEVSWFPEELLKISGPVTAELLLLRKQEFKVEVQGKLQVDVQLCCDRCLQDYNYGISSGFTFIIEIPDADHSWKLHDLECAGDDLDTIQVEEPVVDLGDILRQQVLLSLPEKKICSPSCKGLCGLCGAELNRGKCSCAPLDSGSPFAVLGSLKKNKKD